MCVRLARVHNSQAAFIYWKSKTSEITREKRAEQWERERAERKRSRNKNKIGSKWSNFSAPDEEAELRLLSSPIRKVNYPNNSTYSPTSSPSLYITTEPTLTHSLFSQNSPCKYIEHKEHTFTSKKTTSLRNRQSEYKKMADKIDEDRAEIVECKKLKIAKVCNWPRWMWHTLHNESTLPHFETADLERNRDVVSSIVFDCK